MPGFTRREGKVRRLERFAFGWRGAPSPPDVVPAQAEIQ